MSDFKSLNSSISKFLKNINIGKIKESQYIVELWYETVGEIVSKKTNPVRFTNSTIYVEVDNSAWINEMTFLKEDIIEKYNTKLKKHIVKDIKFFVKRNENSSPNNNYFKKEKKEKKEANLLLNKNTLLIDQNITDEDRININENVKGIEDDELKLALKIFYEKTRKRELSLIKQGWKKCGLCNSLYKDQDSLCKLCKMKEKL